MIKESDHEILMPAHKRFKQILKNELSEFAASTSIHGVQFTNKGPILARVFWSIVVFVIGCYAGYAIYIRTYVLINAEVHTMIKSYQVDSWDIPAITMCNLNIMRKSHIPNNSEIYSLFESAFLFGDMNFPQDDEILKKIEKKINVTEIINNGFHDHKKHFCRLDSIDCKDNYKPLLTDNGICSSFHPFDKNKKRLQMTSGSNEILRLFLYTDVDEYFYGPFSTSTGFRVLIHDPTIYPISGEGNWLIASPGNAVAVDLELIVEKSDNPEEKHYVPKIFPDSNIVNMCQIECKIHFVMKKCKCRPFYVPYVDDSFSLCGFIDYLSCVLKIKGNDFECIKNCPKMHDINIYRYILSYGNFPSKIHTKPYATFLNTTEEDVRRNYVVLEIFFQDSIRIEIIRHTYNFQDYMSDLGGALGVLCGVSIISVLETFAIVFKVFYNFCQQAKNTAIEIKSEVAIEIKGEVDEKLKR